jgi:FtsP/CotA-like multicopper oxidase with cupredoxin domain
MDMGAGSTMPGTGHSMGGMNMGGIDMGAGGMAGMHMPMDHANSAAGSAEQPGNAVGHASTPSPHMAGHSMPGMAMGHASMPETGREPSGQAALKRRMRGSPEVDNVAMTPTERLDEPGDGLSGNGRRVLTYADLRALQPGDDPRPPSREVILHLTGNMERFIWGFDGKKFSEAEPIRLRLGERVRLTLINDTMMDHPIHLHGLWSELENGQGAHRPYKHTINVKPGERLSYLVSADEPGRWAYHCHLLYHMELGMFRTVAVA